MLNRFTSRSVKKELLDDANVDRNLLFKNLEELDILNRVTGGHAISLAGIKQLVTDHDKIYHVVDLGCGSGDTLKVFARWAEVNNYKVRLTGVDMNPNAIEYFKIHNADDPGIDCISADFQDYLDRNERIDIIHCSLFCHHLENEKLLQLFIYFRDHARSGFIINDLQRQWLAYFSAWFFTRLLNGTKLAKNDGPISVLRGFKSAELIHLLDEAKIKNYSLKKKWLFRYLIVGKTGNNEAAS